MTLQNHGVGAEGLLAAAGTLAQPPEEFGNDSRVEELWASKAMEHAEVYFNILCSVDPKQIPRLTSCDGDIYQTFRQDFPDLDVAKMDETHLKSEEAKKQWRSFCDRFKHVDDFSFATLLRLDSSEDYTEKNSTIVPKIQFFAIELARNREGHNDGIRSNFKPIPRRLRSAAKAEPSGQAQLDRNAEIQYELEQILGGKHAILQ